MSEFSYIDIFATKGFEYLLVITFFLVLVGFWSFLSVPKKQIRQAQEEREELRRLIELQRERMATEANQLRDQRESMQNALVARLQVVEHRALAAWNEAQGRTAAAPPDLVQLLNWALAERETFAEDRRRLDYLARLAQSKTSLYSAPAGGGAVIVDVSGRGSIEGVDLRSALDAARLQGVG